MLTIEKTKKINTSNNLNRRDQALILLCVNGIFPKKIAELRRLAIEVGIKSAKKWNISGSLLRSPQYAIRVPDGWEITTEGIDHLKDLDLVTIPNSYSSISESLVSHTERISNKHIKNFTIEAIGCFNAKYFRAACILSWVGAISILQDYILKEKLEEFNKEAVRRDAKFKSISNSDDFERLKEFEFLQIVERIGIIGKNVKQQLEERLKLRNACGHPNNLAISESTAAAHIEILLLNVYERFV